MKLYRIQHNETGLFSTGGKFPKWKKIGKLWKRLQDVWAHTQLAHYSEGCWRIIIYSVEKESELNYNEIKWIYTRGE